MHSEVPPAFSQLCNTHGTHMCLKSSNLSKEFFEGTRITHITVHNTNTFLSLAHTQEIKHCVHGSDKYKIYLFMNTSKIVKGINNLQSIKHL